MNLKETYNRIAEDWYKDHQQDSWWIHGAERFLFLLKPGASVLDAGCGAGVKSRWLLDRGFKVTGIDFSEKMVSIARREAPSAIFHVMDIKEIDGLEGIFEGIFAQAVLLHVPKIEVESVLRGFKSKLNDGGYLYVAVKEKRPGGIEEDVVVEEDYGYQYERFFSYFSKEEVESYLRDLKFEIVFSRTSPTGNTNWIQVIGKCS